MIDAEREGIAVVGIGCRFPGQVSDVEDFRRLLAENRDAVREVPEDRWSTEAARIDPQQRMFLETTWEALQDAGIVAERTGRRAAAHHEDHEE
ncbi:beta-ketoacyl synthase N-terminal-like domain-containing protein [Nocardia sp. NPDC060256]|uniref:beta-ketoacyl synthase N-terminal-like domain-containing protein n=1 Tax=unclassified Nocardia TaxID=2637762 RepID=UPI00366693F0